MPMGRVDHDHVDTGVHKRLGPLKARIPNGGGRSHAQTAQLILAGRGVQNRLFGIFQGQKAGQLAVPIGNEQFFNAARLHQADGLVPVGGFVQDGEVVRTHHDGHGRRIVTGKAHVAIGNDAQNAALFIHHGEPRDTVAVLKGLGIGQGLIGAQCDRVVDDAAFKPFDAADLAGLRIDVQIAVNNAHATSLGHGNGHPPFGHGIHGRAEQRDVQIDALRDTGTGVSSGRQHTGRSRNQQDIIKGKGLANLHNTPLGWSLHLALPYFTGGDRWKG
mmetsp:Transcript_23398/g.40929  ORF Transcript_23398/g.40929 Transcript_23398/m.40929 type:complete len:274 (+) Transcript_23398:223-1044(+)